MPNDHNARMALAFTFILIIGAFMGIAWPSYRNASAMNATIETVQHRIQNQAQEAKSLENLAQRLSSVQDTITRDLREIPRSTSMASLITALTVEVDYENVYDQTFSTSRVHALNGVERVDEDTVFVLPLAIDMDATFPVVFELITKVEQMRRLVRVTSIRIERHAIHEHLVRATVNLELVFEPLLDDNDGEELGVGP